MKLLQVGKLDWYRSKVNGIAHQSVVLESQTTLTRERLWNANIQRYRCECNCRKGKLRKVTARACAYLWRERLENLTFTCEEHSRLRRWRAWRMIEQRRRCHRCCQEVVIAAGATDCDKAIRTTSPRICSPSRHDALAWLRYHLVPKDALWCKRKKEEKSLRTLFCFFFRE